jgi:hypothetical protein
MRDVLSFVAGLAAAPVAALVVRVALSVLTMPLARLEAVDRSKTALRALRLVVGAACGASALLASRWVVVALGGVPGVALSLAVAVMTAAFQVSTARQFVGTPQFVDEMFWLAGEELGIAAVVVVTVLLVS